ncbi:hypothetical protein BC941DRAFT_506775 [Chlamydoabsidia padenii]|nr:hypothetical protein BC941DRAFT_506775 [Chlamydoabsidia padenii]
MTFPGCWTLYRHSFIHSLWLSWGTAQNGGGTTNSMCSRHLSDFRSSFKVPVKNFIEKYDFDKDTDAFPGQLKRFLREGSGITEPLFFSDFFVDCYHVVHLNQRTLNPRLKFKETCPASICLLVVTIVHILVLKIDKKKARLLMTKVLSENSVYASVYHRLLDVDKPGRFHSINSRKPVDWQDEMSEFATRLLALTGVGEDVEELGDDAINNILFG